MSHYSKYRIYTKAVAIVDLVWSATSMLTVIGLVIVFAMMASEVNEKNYQDKAQKKTNPNKNAAILMNAVLFIYIACVAVFAILTARQMWAAFRLLSATDIRRRRVVALRLATEWRNGNVTSTFLMLCIFFFLGLEINFWLAAKVLIRVAMNYIVFGYMEELERMPIQYPI